MVIVELTNRGLLDVQVSQQVLLVLAKGVLLIIGLFLAMVITFAAVRHMLLKRLVSRVKAPPRHRRMALLHVESLLFLVAVIGGLIAGNALAQKLTITFGSVDYLQQVSKQMALESGWLATLNWYGCVFLTGGVLMALMWARHARLMIRRRGVRSLSYLVHPQWRTRCGPINRIVLSLAGYPWRVIKDLHHHPTVSIDKALQQHKR
jgi:hypothetical protein